MILSSNDTSDEDRYGFQIRVINRATSFASESDLYPQSRVVYRVVRLREDSLQLPRPEPGVQLQARPRRVTAACIHYYGFKHRVLASISCRRTLSRAIAKSQHSHSGGILLLLSYSTTSGH